VDRLARVRENQRKSRARKQEHVKELEQRLAVCKEQAQQKDIAHRLATQRVEAENRHLKALLESLGVSRGSVQKYLQDVDAANVNRKIAIPAIQRSEKSETHSPEFTVEMPQIHKDLETKLVTTDGAKLAMQQRDQPKQEEADPAFCGCRSERQESNTSDEDVLNSTLCAIAEEMINQYNTKGVDVDEIRRRIWSGFRAGANGTGCRVQNHVLFQVLDEISGDV
jgi:hypothetical protein